MVVHKAGWPTILSQSENNREADNAGDENQDKGRDKHATIPHVRVNGIEKGYSLQNTEWNGRTLFGHKFEQVPVTGLNGIRCETIQTFVRRHPTGTFLITIPRHCLAVRDGKVFDLNETNMNARVVSAWEVKKSS